MKTIFGAVLAATFACSIFTSCANSNTEKLLGNWQLTFFEKDGVAQEIAIATVNIKSEFKNSIRMDGFSGINRFNGTFDVSGNKLTEKSGFSTTRMAGNPSVMKFETSFMSALQSADSFNIQVEDGLATLIINSSSEKAVLKFQPVKLQNTTWNLTEVLQDDGVVSVYFDSTAEKVIPHFTFSEDGVLSGSTGVNLITLNYTVDENTGNMKIEDGAITLVATDDEEAAKLETTILQLIPNVAKYDISGTTLSLMNVDNMPLLVFQKQELVK